MNPYQTPASVPEAAPSAALRLRRITGSWYRVLGWVSLASSLVSVATAYWTDDLHIDATFILWLWLGSSLRKGRPAARVWAIVIFVFVSLFCLAAPFLPNVHVNFGPIEYTRSHPAFYPLLSVICCMFSVPGILLLGRRGRSAFPGEDARPSPVETMDARG